MRQSALILMLVLALPARARWTPVTRPSTHGLSSVCALSPSAVWAVGDGGQAFFTEDSGASWSQQVTGIADDLLSVSFATPRAGWVSGVGGSAAGTQDGGGFWARQVVAVDDYGLGAPDSVAPIAAASADTAWAVARWSDVTAVCRTTDAGRNWVSVRYSNHSYFAPNTVYTLAAVSSQQVWLLASRIDTAGNFGPVLLRTENAGTDWEIVPLPATQLNQPTSPHWEAALAPVSATETWAYARDAVRGGSALFHVTRSATGAWSAASWDVNAGIRSMRFAAGGQGILVGDATSQTADGFATVRRTANPGGLSLCASFPSATLGFGVAADGSACQWMPDAPGDADGSGQVDLLDAVAALRVVRSGGQTDAITLGILDLAPPGGNGQVTEADVAAILKTAGGTG